MTRSWWRAHLSNVGAALVLSAAITLIGLALFDTFAYGSFVASLRNL